MIKTFTHEKLIRYVYNELPANEYQEIVQAVRHDAELAAYCTDLLLVQRCLAVLQKAPSERATQNILQYSRTFPK